MLPIAIGSMISALTCYSVGVWGEKISGILKNKHLVFFWIGFIFDTVGTTLMGKIAGVFTLNMHGMTGALAIILMLVHAAWASAVLFLKQDTILKTFHRFSLAVWALWLVPFLSGMIMAMGRGG
jgi:uncharacterized repeat protein (TIGR03987 family)